jgi:hypothetical protein
MSNSEARKRSSLPVPAAQYGDPIPGETCNYWDEITLDPSVGAPHATIGLLYQPTGWEYVQFLYLANTGGDPFLPLEGINLLNAWVNTGMAQPYAIASAGWTSTPSSAQANFTGNPTSGVAPLDVSCTNDSAGDYVTCA